MRVILLILIGLSSLSLADFSRSGDIVIDNITKLQWQDNKVTDKMNWQEAIDYCQSLNLGGYSDWRLPNKNELISIVDYSKYNPAIDNQFQNTISYYYWSATSNGSSSNAAWYVRFYSGHTYSSGYKYDGLYVRCVRAGQ